MENETMAKSGFSKVSVDIMEKIFSRLPASSFSSAACVSKSWNNVCGRILKKPKLASALSLKPILQDAVKEVIDKVLAEPIVPHFAIACIGKQFSMEMTHQLLIKRLGSRVPIITNAASGIIGADAVTNKFREVKWESSDDEDDNDDSDSDGDSLHDRGIVLVLGFVPGLKVDAIPLLRTTMLPEISLVGNFLMDIKNFTNFFQDSESPSAIIVFGDQSIDMKPILAMMDCAMDEETVIVGDVSGCFLCRSTYEYRRYYTSYSLDAVALVFARNKYKSPDIGETQFHVTLSTGIMPFGPILQTVGVIAKDTNCSWLTARMEGQFEILDSEDLLNDINSQFDDEDFPDLYIGVIQHRNYSFDPWSFVPRASLAFYEVTGSGERDFFIVNGTGIMPGDQFLFYHSDSETASDSCSEAYRNLEILRKESKGKSSLPLMNGVPSSREKEVFGGLIFSSYRQGETFHRSNDSSPFYENFPEVPLAGVFCSGEIGRGSSSSICQEDDETHFARCCVHYQSTIFLALIYTPPTSEH